MLGHNGCGKSTLAKHLNALLLPTEGTVEVDAVDTANEADLWTIRQTVGMVFQNPDNQLIATTVEEDVAFGPENMGMEPVLIRQRVDEALELVGMAAFKNKEPHLLSGGQKQPGRSCVGRGRRSLAYALAHSGTDCQVLFRHPGSAQLCGQLQQLHVAFFDHDPPAVLPDFAGSAPVLHRRRRLRHQVAANHGSFHLYGVAADDSVLHHPALVHSGHF